MADSGMRDIFGLLRLIAIIIVEAVFLIVWACAAWGVDAVINYLFPLTGTLRVTFIAFEFIFHIAMAIKVLKWAFHSDRGYNNRPWWQQ